MSDQPTQIQIHPSELDKFTGLTMGAVWDVVEARIRGIHVETQDLDRQGYANDLNKACDVILESELKAIVHSIELRLCGEYVTKFHNGRFVLPADDAVSFRAQVVEPILNGKEVQ